MARFVPEAIWLVCPGFGTGPTVLGAICAKTLARHSTAMRNVCSSDGVRGRGAAVKYLPHSAAGSVRSGDSLTLRDQTPSLVTFRNKDVRDSFDDVLRHVVHILQKSLHPTSV